MFKAAQISSKDGYTELDYTNGIKATYTGVNTSKVINLEEKIAFFAKGDVPVPDPKIDHYEVEEIEGGRVDYPTYTRVALEKLLFMITVSAKVLDSSGQTCLSTFPH